MTFPLAVALAELGSALEKSYRNTIYCATILEQDESGRLRTIYCGNRWCIVCNSIRTAMCINRYLPVLKAWLSPHFVTLTLPNVAKEALPTTIVEMLTSLRAICRAVKRTDGVSLKALRKLECTYNRISNTYHPHFHLVVEGREAGEAIVARWLALHPNASPKAQNLRPCDERSLWELFKYFTKLVTKRSGSNSPRQFAPPFALDAIFTAMRGRRVFQSIGFTAPAPPRGDEEAELNPRGSTNSGKRLGELVSWRWVQDCQDWVDHTTGDQLANVAKY